MSWFPYKAFTVLKFGHRFHTLRFQRQVPAEYPGVIWESEAYTLLYFHLVLLTWSLYREGPSYKKEWREQALVEDGLMKKLLNAKHLPKRHWFYAPLSPEKDSLNWKRYF